MSLIDQKADTYVQERLDALYEIDCKIVSLLDGVSTLFQTYSTTKSNSNVHELKEQLSDQTENVYNILSKVAIDLRKEVKAMDDNIGVYDKNKDGVMILPIGVEQKNSSLGKKKLNESLRELDSLLGIAEEEEVVDLAPEVKEAKDEVLYQAENDKDGDIDMEEVGSKEVEVPDIKVEESKEDIKESEAISNSTLTSSSTTEISSEPIKQETISDDNHDKDNDNDNDNDDDDEDLFEDV